MTGDGWFRHIFQQRFENTNRWLLRGFKLWWQKVGWWFPWKFRKGVQVSMVRIYRFPRWSGFAWWRRQLVSYLDPKKSTEKKSNGYFFHWCPSPGKISRVYRSVANQHGLEWKLNISTDKKTRDKAVKNLANFLSNSSQDAAIPDLEMAKLWKGIFYCAS
jgi:hypothetical protein